MTIPKIALVVFGLLLVFLAIAHAESSTELTEHAYDVEISTGVIDLPAGILVGGDPVNYVVLARQTELETISGTIVFEEGTKIDCDTTPPGEQNPCDPF